MARHSSGLVLAVSLASVLLAVAGATAAETRVGVTGPVEPQSSATLPEGGTKTMASGQDVALREKITTDAAGQAEILFLDRSSLRIGPNTEMEIDEFAYSPEDGTGKLAASATKGLLRFSGGALSKHEDQVTLRTPTGILGVRGGIVLVEIGDDGGTQATFLYGDALTITALGGQSVRITTPGYFSDLAANKTGPSPPQAATPAQLEAKLALLPNGDGAGSTSQSATEMIMRQFNLTNALNILHGVVTGAPPVNPPNPSIR